MFELSSVITHMCCVNTTLSGIVCVCVPVSYILLALHASPTDQHSVPEASERNYNTNASVFAERSESEPRPQWPFCSSCFPAFRAPVSPSFTYFSKLADSTRVKLCHHAFAFLLLHLLQYTLPPPLFSSLLFTSSGKLAPSVCWLSPGEKLLHTNGM